MMQPEVAPNVRWGEWIGEGWRMFTERWQVWVLQILLFLLIIAIPIAPIYIWAVGAQMAAAETGAPPELPAMFVPLMFLLTPVLVLATAFLWSGLWGTAIKQLRGQPIAVGDLFSGGDVFLRVLGAMIAIGILAMLGAVLCFFPAFIVMGLLFFTLPLIVDRNLDVGSALSASYEATKKNWLMFTLFAFVVALLASVGQIACYVGLLATYPLQFTITAIAYRDVFGVPGARSFSSAPVSSPTSYAGQSWPVAQQPPQQPSPPPQPVFSQPQPEPPQQAQQQAAMKCPQCGATLTRATKFCNFCGARLQP